MSYSYIFVFFKKGAEFHEVGANLNSILDDTPDRKLNYVAIRGTVKPIGEPLISVNNKDISGVIQKLSTKEHVVARTTTGFWSHINPHSFHTTYLYSLSCNWQQFDGHVEKPANIAPEICPS